MVRFTEECRASETIREGIIPERVLLFLFSSINIYGGGGAAREMFPPLVIWLILYFSTPLPSRSWKIYLNNLLIRLISQFVLQKTDLINNIQQTEVT